MFGNALDREFSRNFLISLGMHVVVFILAYSGGIVISKIFKNQDLEVIRSAVRVDVVGMPKFTIQELRVMQKEASVPKEPEVAVGKKEEVKIETEDVVKKDDLVIQEEGKKKKKASFLSILSEASSKKVAPKEHKKGSEDGKSNRNLDALILEGNRLSSGSALVGDYSDQSNSELSAYVQVLPDIIRRFWKLPSYLKDQNLSCQLRVYISSSGSILKVDMYKSSGNGEFDSRAEKALRDASPFPPPSQAVGDRLTRAGIILGFPL